MTATAIATLKAEWAEADPYEIFVDVMDTICAPQDAVTFASTVTVGADTDGHDVKFFGDTTGAYMEWDESEDKLEFRAAAIRVGTLSSTVTTAGVKVDADRTRVLEVHASDHDTARAVGTQGRAIFGRTMIFANGACEDWGVHGLSKVSSVAKTGNVSAGVVGAFESTGTCSTATGSGNCFVAGVMGRLGLAANFTIGAGTFACGVLSFYNTASASDPTGEYTVAYMATASDIAGTDNWDYGLYFEDITRGGYITCEPSGTSAINAFELTVADATTPASGYAHGIHVTYNKSGVDTGSGCSTMQFNAIGADVTLSGTGGGTAGYYSLYTYVQKSGSPDLSSCAIFGANLELTEMGATDYFGGLWINKYNTTLGTSIDSFILCSNQASGVTTAGIYFQGTKPTYFLQFASADGFLTVDAGTPGANSTHKIACRIGGTTAYIPLYADY